MDSKEAFEAHLDKDFPAWRAHVFKTFEFNHLKTWDAGRAPLLAQNEKLRNLLASALTQVPAGAFSDASMEIFKAATSEIGCQSMEAQSDVPVMVEEFMLVIFDEDTEENETASPLVITKQRAVNFSKEGGWLKHHLEPVYRIVNTHPVPVLLTGEPASAHVTHEDLKITYYENVRPKGIRDRTGFLFFFTNISKYPEQEERYRQEIKEQYQLADYLLSALVKRGTHPSPMPAPREPIGYVYDWPSKGNSHIGSVIEATQHDGYVPVFTHAEAPSAMEIFRQILSDMNEYPEHEPMNSWATMINDYLSKLGGAMPSDKTLVPRELDWNLKMRLIKAMLPCTNGELECIGERLLEEHIASVTRVHKALLDAAVEGS